jgi:hypothetical protein
MLEHVADRDELIKRHREIYNFHRLDLMRQVDFIVTVYDEG